MIILFFIISSKMPLHQSQNCHFHLEQVSDASFIKKMMKLYKVMQHCEQIKQLHPLFSNHIRPIVLLLEKLNPKLQKSNCTLSNRSFGHLSKLSVLDDFHFEKRNHQQESDTTLQMMPMNNMKSHDRLFVNMPQKSKSQENCFMKKKRIQSSEGRKPS